MFFHDLPALFEERKTVQDQKTGLQLWQFGVLHFLELQVGKEAEKAFKNGDLFCLFFSRQDGDILGGDAPFVAAAPELVAP
jgi:hypothetical protein